MKAVHSQPANEPFQTLISDLGLPDGNGFDLVREIRAEIPGITAVALSGFGTDADIQKSMEAGFTRHFTKPISFQDLRRMLAT